MFADAQSGMLSLLSVLFFEACDAALLEGFAVVNVGTDEVVLSAQQTYRQKYDGCRHDDDGKQ